MALIGCLALTACEFGGDDTIFNEFSAQDGNSVSLDAHQRAIITTQVYDRSGNLERTIYCAEPSPDAFASISRTITGSLGRSAEQGGFSAALARDLAKQASAALSARNATIQLLRDGLYRACEGYASGALMQDEYMKITAQYQHIMAALLSIELLSNINRPEHTSYTSPQQDGESGNGEAGKDGAVASGEAQTVVAFKALEHESIESIAVVALTLVKEAMNIGAAAQRPWELEECFRIFEKKGVAQEVVNICVRLISRLSGDILSGDIINVDQHSQAPTFDLRPPATPIEDLTLGQTDSLNFESSEISKIYSFDISQEGEYEIAVTAVPPHHGDPAIILTSTDDTVLGAADDTEVGLDAKIKMALGEGKYELQVFNLEPGEGSFELLIELVEE